MSRQKKSRSLKRIHPVKTGRRSAIVKRSSGTESRKCTLTSKSNSCTASNDRQSKSRYSASNPKKKQRSVYQQYLDSQ